MAEARLEDSGSGLAPAGDGWFVVNVRDAECGRISRGMAIDWRGYLVPDDVGSEWVASSALTV